MTEDWRDRAYFLEGHVIKLNERIRYLENLLGMLRKPPLIEGFTKSEAKIMHLLLNNKVVHRAVIVAALYPDCIKRGDKVGDVFIHHMRRKLPPGQWIRAAHGVGYFIRPEDKPHLRQMLAIAPQRESFP